MPLAITVSDERVDRRAALVRSRRSLLAALELLQAAVEEAERDDLVRVGEIAQGVEADRAPRRVIAGGHEAAGDELVVPCRA